VAEDKDRLVAEQEVEEALYQEADQVQDLGEEALDREEVEQVEEEAKVLEGEDQVLVGEDLVEDLRVGKEVELVLAEEQYQEEVVVVAKEALKGKGVKVLQGKEDLRVKAVQTEERFPAEEEVLVKEVLPVEELKGEVVDRTPIGEEVKEIGDDKETKAEGHEEDLDLVGAE